MNKRRDLSVKEKLDVLKKYDELPKMSQRQAACKLNLSQSLLGRMLKSRQEIEGNALENVNSNRKRKRAGKEEEVEEALEQWFIKVREKDARVTGPLLRQKSRRSREKNGALPEHTYAFKNEKTRGTITSKERLTILCCASMDGEKRKLLAIGKSKDPRCFKGVKNLPVDYLQTVMHG
ncbi:tigger transposable element-derived protein 3-like [Melanaphis sacchari]|uniref:tigger transposable element-derived protein 3-like n=1 Tax=Melanaphis sacchari TaxID=742174 RepID=UPI000DC14687|nr:tigger transposable element-derived protein 3-like [Melanaphis sacchari]